MYFDENSWLFTECEEDDEGGFSPVAKVNINEFMLGNVNLADPNNENEYTLQPLLAGGLASVTLTGDYFAVIVIGPDIVESVSNAASTLSAGDYFEVVAARSYTEPSITNAGVASVSGGYNLIIYVAPDQVENVSNVVSTLMTSAYTQTVFSAPDQSEATSSQTTLRTGAYTAV
jgi:hypothetical protein